MIWNTRKIRSGFRQGLQIFLWYDPKLGWHLEDFRGFVRSPDRTFGVFEMRSGDRTAFLGLLKFCPNFGQDFLLFTTPVPLKKIVYKLIEIVCKLFFLVIFVPNKQDIMKRLTAREEEIMGYFWTKGPLFVKQLLEFYDEPRPHFNTLSTIVRGLEEKGFLAHHTFGNTNIMLRWQKPIIAGARWKTSLPSISTIPTSVLSLRWWRRRRFRWRNWRSW